ncbi:Mediator of RNA polymerase II transcription subunit 13 [Talaromyces islandicus]|uniref:Mediator of RNA polymerase II transcription subunit 13 n=1 Tax=Talaromyces islandicus TaxID=28573 RepID=A0A0U1LNL7_TALIS|nr:Mediator of RNA polymerase II transcription subunit 13 [Talaromyces islandicus]
MEFPGDAITNISVINGFSVIYWRIYNEETSISTQASETVASNGYSILKLLSRLKDLEIKLRNLGCHVSYYPRRLGLWIFSSTPGFESVDSFAQESPNQDLNAPERLIIGGTSLKVSASGSVTATDLIRSLSADPSSNSSGRTNYPVIYASFVSAIAGLVSLQLTRRLDAIPLGARTLFTPIERSFFSGPTIADSNANALPALTTLRIELSLTGKAIVSLNTVYQDGISRLGGYDITDVNPVDMRPNTDIWLAPNGTVARLIAFNAEKSNVFAERQKSDVTTRQFVESRQMLWKDTVVEWMRDIGLTVSSPEEEHWVEVEVSEPFYARFAADYLRQLDDIQSVSPLKRILWPSRFCFKRAKITSASLIDDIDSLVTDCDDPVNFAENWIGTAGARQGKPVPSTSHMQQTPQNKESSTPRIDFPEQIESLARVAQYPDLQSASTVYPTPPDGALVSAMNQTASDAFGSDGHDISMSRPTGDGIYPRRGVQIARNPGDATASRVKNESEVATGLYDTNGDEDLFGDIDDKAFGPKGITDDDFNFFDDPEIDDFDMGKDFDMEKPIAEPTQETPQQPQQPQLETVDIQTPQAGVSIENPQDEVIMQPSVNPDPQGDQGPGSVLNVEKIETNEHQNIATATPHGKYWNLPEQAMSPPLSPIEVKKILFSTADTDTTDANKDTKLIDLDADKKQSRYDSISFQQGLTMSDQKYSSSGHFFFAAQKRDIATANPSSEIPLVGFPRGRKPTHTHQPEKLNGTQQSPSATRIPRSTSVSSSETSFDSSDDDYERESSPARLATLKRKRPLSEAERSTTSSLERLSIASETDTHFTREDCSVFLGNFFSITTDWSLAGYFAFKQNHYSPVLIRKEDHVQLAQLMVDQLAQSSLSHKIDGCKPTPDLENDTVTLHTPLDDTSVLGENERLDLKTLVSLHDNMQMTMETPSARPNMQRKDVKGSITKISLPHLHVHRGKDYLDILPSSMSFWETFGLEPANGPKDISAYCIYPHFATEAADAFMTRLGLVYSGCSFGQHVRGDRYKPFENGLGAWSIAKGDGAYMRTMQSLKNLCESLGAALSKVPAVKENFVIYVINPFTHGAAFADISAAFLHLFHKYIGDVDRNYAKSQMNELVLQIIPMNFVYSPTSLAVPTQWQYLNLALEVYGRCPPKDASDGITGYAPPIVLADAAPKSLPFRVTSERVSPFQEGRCLHLAISRSVDQRWISAAWSDSSGSFQILMSYCLRARGSNVNRTLSEVRQEIWETTKDIMERTQTRSKVFLVRTEPIDQEEAEAWNGLAARYNQSKAMPVELTLLSVNITPGLHLQLPAAPISTNMINPPASTPVATPYGGVSSPDQFGVGTPASGGQGPMNAVTPTDLSASAEPDSDALLIDAHDESWAVILSHRLNNSTYITEYRPALVSGYLLRRKGVNDSQGVAAMSVSLIHTSRPSGAYETVLREALNSYRDLATLARAKGTLAVQHNTLPWHIATAVKGQEFLSYVF